MSGGAYLLLGAMVFILVFIFLILLLRVPQTFLRPSVNTPVPLLDPGHSITSYSLIPQQVCELPGPITVYPKLVFRQTAVVCALCINSSECCQQLGS